MQVAAAVFFRGNVAGLNAVYDGEPRRVEPTDWGDTTGVLSAAVAWPFLSSQSDTRIAVGGAHGGVKVIVYDIVFAVRFKSTQVRGEDADLDFLSLVDNFSTRLRSDRTLGGVAWQAGEGSDQEGHTDIHWHHGEPEPRKVGGPIMIFSYVEFQALEQVST